MIDNQGVALAVLPQKGSQALAQGASAVTGVQQQLSVRRGCASIHRLLVHIRRVWFTSKDG